MMKKLMGNVMSNKRIKYFVCMLVFFALLFIGYKYFKAQSIIKDGEVLAGMVRIADQKYVYQAFMTTGKKKKISTRRQYGRDYDFSGTRFKEI